MPKDNLALCREYPAYAPTDKRLPKQCVDGEILDDVKPGAYV